MNFFKNMIAGAVAKVKETEILKVVDTILGRISRLSEGFSSGLSDDFKKGVSTAMMSAADEALSGKVIDQATYDAVKKRVDAWYSCKE